MKRIYAWLIAVIVALCLPLSHADDISGAFIRYVEAAASDGQINGSVLVAEKGRILWERQFGFADFENRKPVTSANLFPLASISKPFTAVAILQLMERGRLRLDDPLALYLKGFPYPKITIRQLLSHTSGLPEGEPLFEPLIAADSNRIIGMGDLLPTVISYQRAHPTLPLQPGEKWSYSSLGYSLLALLTQQLSGMPFADYVKQNIFLPAGMKDSYVQTNLAQGAESNRTINYLYSNHYDPKLEVADKLAEKRPWAFNYSGLMGAGNVVSSASDLSRFDRALDSNVLLKPETIERAFTRVKLADGRDNQAVHGTSYGLGWFIFDDTSHGKIVWHSGSAPGVTTLLARNIATKQCFVVLLNVACSNGVYFDLLDLIQGQPHEYRPSLAFAYGRDLFLHGPDFAACRLGVLRGDLDHYSLKESEIDRVGLEFSRVRGLGDLSREAYKMGVLLFPGSSTAFEHYGDSLLRAKKTEAARLAYQRSVALNPANEAAHEKLKPLAGP